MVKRSKAFKITRKVAKVAVIMTYVGLGSSQFTISPSLSDIQTTVSEMFITPTAAIFEEEHDVTDMHCMDVRDPDPDRMMVVSVVGGNSLVRDLAVTA